MDQLKIKPTLHNIKSHLAVTEAASMLIGNPALVEWLISNEAADAAAAIFADNLGSFDAELKTEELTNTQLWSVLEQISAIELHIRNSEEDLGDMA